MSFLNISTETHPAQTLSNKVNTKDLFLATTCFLPLQQRPVLQVPHCQHKDIYFSTKPGRWHYCKELSLRHSSMILIPAGSQSKPGGQQDFPGKAVAVLNTTQHPAAPPHSCACPAPLTHTVLSVQHGAAQINVLTPKTQHCHTTPGLQEREQQVSVTGASLKCCMPTLRSWKHTEDEGGAEGVRGLLRMLRAV